MTQSWMATSRTVLGTLALAGLTAVSAHGQTSDAAAKSPRPKAASWQTPKTQWGDPDLQGSWTTDSAYAIPMQRPEKFSGRAEF